MAVPMSRCNHSTRTKLAENADLIKNTDAPSEIRKLEQSIKSFRHLAQNEDWLADNFDKMIHSRDLPSKDESEAKPLDGEAVAKIEEHILRCLGAAVMMHWSRSQRSCNASFSIPRAR